MQTFRPMARANFLQPRFQIALRAALAIMVALSIGVMAMGQRTIAQRNVAAYLARNNCVLGYMPTAIALDNEAESGLRFHAVHSLHSVTIYSMEEPGELVEQLSRIDTLKKIRIEYASGGGCAFAVAPRIAGIERIKAMFPSATVEVKFTFIRVVG